MYIPTWVIIVALLLFFPALIEFAGILLTLAGLGALVATMHAVSFVGATFGLITRVLRFFTKLWWVYLSGWVLALLSMMGSHSVPSKGVADNLTLLAGFGLWSAAIELLWLAVKRRSAAEVPTGQ